MNAILTPYMRGPEGEYPLTLAVMYGMYLGGASCSTPCEVDAIVAIDLDASGLDVHWEGMPRPRSEEMIEHLWEACFGREGEISHLYNAKREGWA